MTTVFTFFGELSLFTEMMCQDMLLTIFD